MKKIYVCEKCGRNDFANEEECLKHEESCLGIQEVENVEYGDFLESLSDEKLEEMGYVSDRQQKCYHERFGKCACVEIYKYKDGISGSKCFNGVFGDDNGKSFKTTEFGDCFGCQCYEERPLNIEIPIIDYSNSQEGCVNE